MKRLLIVGAGGHGRSVAEVVLLAADHQLIGFLDDAPPLGGLVWEWPVLGPISSLTQYGQQVDAVIVAIGNNQAREEVHRRLHALSIPLGTAIHPRATVSPRASIGAGCAIMAGAIVGTEAKLGEGVIVNCGAVVDHHCKVDDFGHLGVHACMAGGSVLGHHAWMQAGSALGYGVCVTPKEIMQPGEAR